MSFTHCVLLMQKTQISRSTQKKWTGPQKVSHYMQTKARTRDQGKAYNYNELQHIIILMSSHSGVQCDPTPSHDVGISCDIMPTPKELVLPTPNQVRVDEVHWTPLSQPSIDSEDPLYVPESGNSQSSDEIDQEDRLVYPICRVTFLY